MIARLKQFIDFLDISVRKFEENCNLGNGRIQKCIRSNSAFGVDGLIKIAENYPQLNVDWLINGRGEMLFSELQNVGNSRKISEHSVVKSFNESVKNLYEKVINEKDERIAELNSRIEKQCLYIDTLMEEHKNELSVILELGRANNSMLKDGTSYINTIRTRVSGFQHGEDNNVVSRL